MEVGLKCCYNTGHKGLQFRTLLRASSPVVGELIHAHMGTEKLGRGSRKLQRGPKHGQSDTAKTLMDGYGLQPPMVSRTAAAEGVVSTSFLEHDAAYFHSYSHVGIHEEMIKAIAPHPRLLFPLIPTESRRLSADAHARLL